MTIAKKSCVSVEGGPPIVTSEHPARDPSISNLRFLCIFAMVFVHADTGIVLVTADHSLPYLGDDNIKSLFLLIIHDGFGRISAPLLGFLSGYFLATNLRSRSYLTILAARTRTLYLPVIIWSAVFLAAKLVGAIVVSDWQFIEETLKSLDANSFLGVSDWPLNYPLHYLVDLFKCVLFAPLALYTLTRFGRVAFITLIGTIFLVLISSDLTGENDLGSHGGSVLPRADLFVFFFIGLFVHHLWNGDVIAAVERFSFKRKAVLLLLAAVFLLGALHWRWMATFEGGLANFAGAILLLLTRTSGCLLILSALQWIRTLGERGFVVDDKLTFRLFTTHVISYFVLSNSLMVVLGVGFLNEYKETAFVLFPFIAVFVAYMFFKMELIVGRKFARFSA